MKVFPPHLLPSDTDSNAESLVHDLLAASNHDGIAFHSINLPTRNASDLEADFVVLTKFGLLVIEVKGGEVSHQNGRWFTRPRGKKVKKELSPGPFQQAERAMYALFDRLKNRIHFPYRYAYAAVFPDTENLPILTEHDNEQWGVARECRNTEEFDLWLSKLFDYWRGRNAKDDLKPGELEHLAKVIRPDFEASVPIGQYALEIDQEIQKFSEEQFERLDEILVNPRILCQGGAGTGKTFLLVEVAKRALSQGRSVLITAASQSLLNEVISRQLQLDDWSDLICICPAAELQDISTSKKFDVALIDEGQDLLAFDFLEPLDALISGGIEDGEWRWFMDDQLQAGFRQIDQDALDYLTHRGVTQKRLTRNCRNTFDIVETTQQLTGAEIGKTVVQGKGEDPEITFCDTAAIQIKKVSNTITQLLARHGVRHDQIVVLLPSKNDLKNFETSLDKRVRICSVEDFKGLESQFVILSGWSWSDTSSDEDSQIRRFLYTGMTRARTGLHVILPNHLNQFVRNSIQAFIKETNHA